MNRERSQAVLIDTAELTTQAGKDMDTSIFEMISEKRESILALWQAAVRANGPLSHGLPLDTALKEQATSLLEWLISGESPVKARPFLKEICELKAVSGLNPSEALGFIPELKGIIRLVLDEHTDNLSEVDRRIDQLLLLAFDEYSDCRERIMEIKVDEIRRSAGRLTR